MKIAASFAVAFVTLLLAPAAQATAIVWTGVDGDLWSTTTWSPSTPSTGDTVSVTTLSTATLNYDASSNPTLNSLLIEGTGGASMTLAHAGLRSLTTGSFTLGNASDGIGFYTQSGAGSLTVNNSAIVGGGGTGGITQNGGGSVSVGSLTLGDQANSTGTYGLSSGSLSVTNDLIAGSLGTGTFNQDNSVGNSTVSVGGNLTLGAQSGGSGTYNLTDSGTGKTLTLSVGGNLLVGDQGTGVFNQSGGAVSVGGEVALGVNSFSGGSYTIGSGSLTASSLQIGGSSDLTLLTGGTGQFVQNGGTVTVGPNGMIIGQFGGTGEYDLNGGTLSVTGVAYVSGNNFGTFNQTGGTFNVDFLNVGILSGGLGVYNMSGAGSTLNVSANLGVGGNMAEGTFTQNDGAVVVGDSLFVNGDPSSSTFGSDYLIIGGTLTVGTNAITSSNHNNIVLGGGGGTRGTLTQTGGSVVVGNGTVSSTVGTQGVYIGANSGDNGAYIMSGGSLEVWGNSAPGNPTLTVGAGGVGLFSQSGGSVTLHGSNGLAVGDCCGGSGEYDMSGNASLSSDGNVYVGAHTTGVFTQTDSSSVTVGTKSGDLYVGYGVGTGANGTYQILGDSKPTLNVLGNMWVGYGDGANLTTGEVDQSAGTVSVNGSLTLGANALATGTYNLTGTGTLNVEGAEVIGDFGNGIFKQGDGSANTSHTVGGDLSLGLDGGSGRYTLTDGSLQVSGNENLGGNAGFGSFNQSGGTHTVGLNLSVGAGANSSGTFMLGGTGSLAIMGTVFVGGAAGSFGAFNFNTAPGDAATLSIGNGLYVGYAGQGIFRQGGGDVHVTTLDIGVQAGSVGIYSLNGGTLESDMIVGDAGIGNFGNGGQTNTVTGNLVLGNQTTGNGTYNLTKGGTTAVSADSVVGMAGTGTFLNDGSTHNTGALIIAQAGTSMGTYTLQNGGVVNIGVAGNPGFFDVAEHGVGTFTQTSGTTTIVGALDIGRCGGAGCFAGDAGVGVGSGVVNLSGGSISVLYDAHTNYGGFVVVGDAGTGNLSQSGNATLTANEIDIGRVSGGNGTYALSGTGSVTVGNLYLGAGFDNIGGQGRFTQTGTTTVNAGTVTIGFGTGSSGEYDLSGGTLSVSGNLYVGAMGQGTFNQSVGAVTTSQLSLGNNMGGSGTYNLSGGSLAVKNDTFLGAGVPGPSSGVFNQSGGTAALGGNLWVGYAGGGTGIYNLSGGALTVAGNLDIGTSAGAIGQFNFNSNGGNGTLAFITPGSMLIVGDHGTGTFNQGGGDLNLTAEGIGFIVGSGGTYNLTGGTLEIDATIDPGGTFVQGGPSVLKVTNGITIEGTYLALGGGPVMHFTGLSGQLEVLFDANGPCGESLHVCSPSFTANGTSTLPFLDLGWDHDNAYNFTVRTIGPPDPPGDPPGPFASFNWGGGDLHLPGTQSSIIMDGFSQVNITGGSLFVPNLVSVGDGGLFNVSGASATVGTSGNPGTMLIASRGSLTLENAASMTVNGALTNSGSVSVANSTITVNGVTNNNQGATIHVSNSTANWNGTFFNNGAYISDPSTNHFITLDVGAAGYLVGGSGDVFDVTGDFLNSSTQDTLWDTSLATLEFSTGTSSTHMLELTGIDLGPIAGGFNNNFAWGILEIDPGNSIMLVPDGNAFYVAMIEGLDISGNDITNIFGDGLNIYYDPAVDTALGDQIFALENGGFLCPIGADACKGSTGPPPPLPEPSSLLLIGGGLMGLIWMRRRARDWARA